MPAKVQIRIGTIGGCSCGSPLCPKQRSAERWWILDLRWTVFILFPVRDFTVAEIAKFAFHNRERIEQQLFRARRVYTEVIQ